MVSFFIFIFAGAVFAGGRMVIKPAIDTGMSYDANYFSDAENERPVAKYYIRPGLEFGYTTAKSNLLFDYVLSSNWYDEKGDTPDGQMSADEYGYISQDMNLDADTQLNDRFNLGLKESYILTRDSKSLDYYTNETIKQKYEKNILNPKILYQFGEKFGISTGYTSTIIDYKSNTDEDSREHRGAFSLQYNLNHLNALDLGYQGWKKDYEENSPDYTSNQLMLTFSRALKYHTLYIGVGYQERRFDDNELRDMDSYVYNLQVSATRPQMLFELSQNMNDTAIDDEYYIATRFYSEYTHLFLEKLNVKLKGHYQKSDYQHNIDNRKDHSWSVSCRVDYLRNELFSIGLETGYETSDSNISVNDYDNSFVLIEIRLNFNVGSR